MRIVKNYPEFISMNEGAMGMIGKLKNAIKRLSGRGADYLKSLMYQVTGQRSSDGRVGTLPYGVTIYPSKYDIEVLGISPQPEPTDDSDSEASPEVSEAIVPLDFPDPKAGVPNVGNKELMMAVRLALEFPNSKPLMIWGAPGIGKTSIVRAVLGMAKDIPPYGGRLIAIQLSTYMAEDFMLPSIKEGDPADSKASAWLKKRITRVPQEWLPLYHVDEGEAGNARANGPDGKGGLIFMDELSRADISVRQVALSFVQERELDGVWKLGSNWRIISASNRAEDDPTNAKAFGSALGNRFNQVNYSPTFKEDFEPWALSAKNPDETPVFDRRLLSFLSSSQGAEFFHKMDPKYPLFPSPRSWENAMVTWNNMAELYRKEGKTLTNDDIRKVIQTAVGKEAANAFLEYLELSSLVDLDKVHYIYTDQTKAPLPPRGRAGEKYRIDVAYLMAMYASYVHHSKTLSSEEATQYIDYLIRLDDPTVAQVFYTALIEKHPYLGTMVNASAGMTDDQKRTKAAWIKDVLRYAKKYPSAAKELANLEDIKRAAGEAQ